MLEQSYQLLSSSSVHQSITIADRDVLDDMQFHVVAFFLPAASQISSVSGSPMPSEKPLCRLRNLHPICNCIRLRIHISTRGVIFPDREGHTQTPVEISFIIALDPKETTAARRFQEKCERGSIAVITICFSPRVLLTEVHRATPSVIKHPHLYCCQNILLSRAMPSPHSHPNFRTVFEIPDASMYPDAV